MKNKLGFTLAEVLITLAIIGVVAALTIPSVVANTQQQEFKTGLKKAVSVLNSAITMNMAIDGESPYENVDLFRYLMRHMNVMKSVTRLEYEAWYTESIRNQGVYLSVANSAFYTLDGMRFEFPFMFKQNYTTVLETKFPLHENNKIYGCLSNAINDGIHNDSLNKDAQSCGGCGSYGLNSNQDNTTKPPCIVIVDVNGDRKPNPYNAFCKSSDGSKCFVKNKYTFSDPKGKKLTDVFPIMITDKQAIPYGVAAQKAMYNTQK